MNADRRQAKFATALAPEPLEFRIQFIKYPLGARDELQADSGEAGALSRPFEQDDVKLALYLVQPAAQGGLAYVQGFRILSQAAALGRYDRQSPIAKLYIHTAYFIGLLGRLSQTLPPIAPPFVTGSA